MWALIKLYMNKAMCGVLSTFFRYPPKIRKIIYTTNAIEGLHRQFRKITKTKGSFPNDQSLMKMLYLATRRIEEKWTIRYRDWDRVIAALSIMRKPLQNFL